MERTAIILLIAGLITLQISSSAAGSRVGKKDFCQLTPEQGPCRGAISKWHYDSSSGECRNFTYGGCRGNANQFQSKAICELVCKPGCRYERCSNSCPHGFIIDSSGCNTCRCQPGPEQSSCPSVDCPTTCPGGYRTDSNGCMTCNCRPEPPLPTIRSYSDRRSSRQHRCPPVCYMFCEFGNKQDENGCDICACKSKEEVCGSQQCMLECPTGFVTDNKGCELCKCKTNLEAEPSCPTNHCLKECMFGFKKDSFGCEVCECASRRDRNSQTSDCSNRPICSMKCPYGFLKGRDGCDTCSCAGRRSDRRTVRTEKRIERRTGRGPSSEDACGVRIMCTMFCQNGFKKDSKGCNICACREDVQPAHTPAENTSDSPAHLPANIPVQLPANIPSQQPGDTPAQLPADISDEQTDCSPKKCHKRTSCAFGFIKDEFGCDTCVCNNARRRPVRRNPL